MSHLSNPSRLRSFLNSLSIKPSQRLSQNFLIDGNIVRKIVKIADVKPKDLVLEIGPGPGALTEELLRRGAIVYAIEKDRKLGEALHRFEDRNLHIFLDDALKFPFNTLPKKLKVIANLPYNITSSLLEKLLEYRTHFTSLTLMIQKEVADRLFASPSTKNFSSLTVFCQFYTECKARFTVKASCFYPKPKVDSAVVHLRIREALFCKDPSSFFLVVRTAFQKRRKKLTSSLRELFSREEIESALIKSSFSLDTRPEDLSLEKWVIFFKALEAFLKSRKKSS